MALNMITNRTLEDVQSIDKESPNVSKGAYNYTDLNRVESKVKELNDILIDLNYMTALTTKRDWTYTDGMKSATASRYLNNVNAIRNALPPMVGTPSTPETLDRLNYEQANDIEKILTDTEKLITGLENWVIYSGVSNSGQPRVWQHRFRNFFAGFDTIWGDFSDQTWADLGNDTWADFKIGG